MASVIVIACPSCQKQVKAPAEAQGKKVRCKDCGEVFPIRAPGSPPLPTAKPGPAKPAVKLAAKPASSDEDGPQEYGVVKEESTIPRCPHCAKEMADAEAVICLHCGYNTITRNRIQTRQVYEATPEERTMWLLPGFVAVGGIIALVLFDLFYCLIFPMLVSEESDWHLLTLGGFRVWAVVASLFGMFYAGRFAYDRLVLHPNPPEIEKKK